MDDEVLREKGEMIGMTEEGRAVEEDRMVGAASVEEPTKNHWVIVEITIRKGPVVVLKQILPLDIT
jgi:hypothetical protein